MEEKPNSADIVSFSVLARFLDRYSKDYDYCLELKEKGRKLLELVENKRLGSNQYRLFLEKKLPDLKE